MSSFNVSELISAFSSISSLCQDLCRKFPNDQMVILKGRAVAEKYASDLRSPVAESIIKKALREFTQILLDVSFLEENQLVEDEFPATDGKTRMNKLLDLYARPVELVKKVFGDFSLPMEVLGKDLVECLHWRKGALLYMYSSTLQDHKERIQPELSHYLKCLEEGVRHLESMLAVRLPPNEAQIASPVLNDDTLSLIKQGLFSDTHILALMYAGEMCYWHHSLVTQKTQKEPCSSRKAAAAGVAGASAKSSSNTLRPDAALGLNHSAEGDVSAITRSASNLEIAGDDVWQARHPGNRHSIHVCEGAFLFDGRSTGKTMLERYVKIVKGPLRFVGWDCVRAEELLLLLDTQV